MRRNIITWLPAVALATFVVLGWAPFPVEDPDAPDGHEDVIYRLDAVSDRLAQLPFTVKVLLENVLRSSASGTATEQLFVTGSEIERWGLGAVQEIDAAAMHVWARWQNMGLEESEHLSTIIVHPENASARTNRWAMPASRKTIS